ncbi:MAG TPA: hypothetical protein VFQ44_01740 [Streptosporangiaceae bacterium]|nr:hypothetical protein [Streptosporangiaceae bacterium]
MRMYHGNYESAMVLHPGLCLTDDDDAARDYGRPGIASDGWLHELDLDIDAAGLVILEVAGYDHDANEAAGDYGDGSGADILIFADETDAARRHDTWRLMTPAALAACTVISSTSEKWEY